MRKGLWIVAVVVCAVFPIMAGVTLAGTKTQALGFYIFANLIALFSMAPT